VAAPSRRAALALLAGVTLLVLAPGARAGIESAGTRAATFLADEDAPGALGMAGAALALGRDVQGAALNPAALGWLTSPQLTLAHAEFADQTTREWLAAGMRLGLGRTTLGLAVRVHDEGTLEGRDENDLPTGSFRAQDLALTLQLARPFGPHLSIGGAAHGVHQRIGEASGIGLAFDAGGQWRSGPLSLALAGRDFGGGMTWNEQRWRMPARFAAGLGLEHAASGLSLALDFDAPADAYRDMRLGAQWLWRERFALRGGWKVELGAPAGENLGGPAFGLGAGLGALWLDYSFATGGDGLATHRAALSLHRAPRAASAGAPAGSPPQR
jgi:hypothetical protein